MLGKGMKREKTGFVSISYGEKVVSIKDILQKIHPNSTNVPDSYFIVCVSNLKDKWMYLINLEYMNRI